MRMLAYLDPGSGSIILQALVGGVAAVAVIAKLWWRRALEFLGIHNRGGSTRREDERASRP
jgi:hypothetical protein